MPLQQVLAFASLIVMFVVFSLASPNFATFTNVVGILLSTAVIGDPGGGRHLCHHYGRNRSFRRYRDDVRVGHHGSASSATGACRFPSACWGACRRRPLRLRQRHGHGQDEGASLYRHPGHDDDVPRPFARDFGDAAHLFSRARRAFARSRWVRSSGIPNAVWIFFASAVIGSLILTKTVLGRYTFALGSNEEATRLSGINVDRWKIAVYTLCGLYSGLAGVVMASRLNSAQPALGAGYELEAIAAVVIGGTSLSGGEGSVLGTVIGAFHHERPHQRPADPFDPAGVAKGGDRSNRHRRCVRRHCSPAPALKARAKKIPKGGLLHHGVIPGVFSA